MIKIISGGRGGFGAGSRYNRPSRQVDLKDFFMSPTEYALPQYNRPTRQVVKLIPVASALEPNYPSSQMMSYSYSNRHHY